MFKELFLSTTHLAKEFFGVLSLIKLVFRMNRALIMENIARIDENLKLIEVFDQLLEESQVGEPT